jgi:hypothetical protein
LFWLTDRALLAVARNRSVPLRGPDAIFLWFSLNQQKWEQTFPAAKQEVV